MEFKDQYGKIIDHLKMERDEQLQAEKYVTSDCVVLELGARYGTVSCIINKKVGPNMVVVEPDIRVQDALEQNMKANDFLIGVMFYYAIFHEKYSTYVFMKNSFEIICKPILIFFDKKFKLISIDTDKKKIYDKNGITTQICNKLKNEDNYVIFISPEGTRKCTEKLRSGYWYIAKNLDLDILYLGIDYSSKEITTEEYRKICLLNGFEHIKKENLGICGGRQFIAEHADENNFDFYFFFEDDMFFYPKQGEVCKNGFNRRVNNLYINSLEITKKEDLDFLKMNYTEFYGDNGTQWAWYNVPQSVRDEFWPGKPRLPEMGLDPNAPKTKFDMVISHKGVPYAVGEVYYCNWPQIVSKEGSKKMFLETTWARPFEQTWMSYIYQEMKKDRIYAGLLMMTPTEHDRFEHYDRSLRKES
jgi:hypothetical protein